MFAPAISKAAGALAGAHTARPTRSVKDNSTGCGVAHGSVQCAARSLPVRFASPTSARLPVTPLRVGYTSRHGRRDLTVRAEGGGQYGERFADVDRVLVSYFTFRALKETLTQIQETDVSPNKTEYKWLYEFASANNPNDSQAFIKALFAQRPDYGQRILAQRQSLFEQWEKSFMPASVGKIVEDQNLEHLRDQLFATVNLSEECLFTGDELECIPEKEKENEKVEAVRSKNNVVPVQDQLLTEAAELPDYGEPEIA